MEPADDTSIGVEVVYCPPDASADRIALRMPAGSTVADALRASRLDERHDGLDPAAPVGIWGRRCARDTTLHDGDRVELYRPLTVDPKEARRLRYRGQKAASNAGRGPARR